MPEIPFAPEVFNIVLLGSDARPNLGGYRTDTMMVISVNRKDDTITMISFPRDLYVYLPGWRMDRINTADVRGGFEMTRQTILYNFGIPLDAWARVSFTGFTSAVDTLGGITVQSTGYLQDECGGVIRTYGAGSYHMDGFEALCYVRMRKVTGDFDRLRRQQEVVRALFNKVLSINGLARMPELYNQFYNSVQTNVHIIDLIPLIPTAAEVGLDPGRIRHFSVTRSMATFWRTPGGASVLLPDRQAVRAMLTEAFGPDVIESAE
jgi:LCP family protein required for cell wall assembly